MCSVVLLLRICVQTHVLVRLGLALSICYISFLIPHHIAGWSSKAATLIDCSVSPPGIGPSSILSHRIFHEYHCIYHTGIPDTVCTLRRTLPDNVHRRDQKCRSFFVLSETRPDPCILLGARPGSRTCVMFRTVLYRWTHLGDAEAYFMPIARDLHAPVLRRCQHGPHQRGAHPRRRAKIRPLSCVQDTSQQRGTNACRKYSYS